MVLTITLHPQISQYTQVKSVRHASTRSNTHAHLSVTHHSICSTGQWRRFSYYSNRWRKLSAVDLLVFTQGCLVIAVRGLVLRLYLPKRWLCSLSHQKSESTLNLAHVQHALLSALTRSCRKPRIVPAKYPSVYHKTLVSTVSALAYSGIKKFAVSVSIFCPLPQGFHSLTHSCWPYMIRPAYVSLQMSHLSTQSHDFVLPSIKGLFLFLCVSLKCITTELVWINLIDSEPAETDCRVSNGFHYQRGCNRTFILIHSSLTWW